MRTVCFLAFVLCVIGSVYVEGYPALLLRAGGVVALVAFAVLMLLSPSRERGTILARVMLASCVAVASLLVLGGGGGGAIGGALLMSFVASIVGDAALRREREHVAALEKDLQRYRAAFGPLSPEPASLPASDTMPRAVSLPPPGSARSSRR